MDGETGAALQPEAKAQTSTETKSGPANLTGAELAQRFIRRANDAEKAVTKGATEATPAETPAEQTEKTEDVTATGAAQANPAEPETEATEKPEETKSEPEAAEEGEKVLSPETQSLEKLKERFDRRIGKEVSVRKELEKQLNELKVQLIERTVQQPQEQAKVVPMPTGVMPLANIDNDTGLANLEREAKATIRFVEDQIERDDFPEQGLEIDGKLYRKQDLRDIRRNAKETLEDHIPARRGFLTQRAQYAKISAESFPFLTDSSDPLYVQAKALKAQSPWLKNLPGGDFVLGAYVKGLAALQAEQAAKAKAAGKNGGSAQKAAKPSNSHSEVSAGTGAERIPNTTAAAKAAKTASDEAKAKGGLNGKDFAKLLSLKAQLRQQTR